MEYKAKTFPSIDLCEHLKKVGETCEMMWSRVSDNNDMKILCYFAGLIHDLGKCNASFQKYLSQCENGSEEKLIYANHNVAGFIYINKLIKSITIDDVEVKPIIEKAVLYHHPVFYSDFELIKKYTLITKEDIYAVVKLIEDLSKIIEERYPSKVKIKLKKIDDNLVDYISYDIDPPFYLEENAEKFFFVRCIVNPSDVMVSRYEKNSNRTIEEIFDEVMECDGNKNLVFIKPNGYDERFDVQREYVEKFLECGKSLIGFSSTTGFGKTMLGLMYLLTNTSKRAYWICSQNSIARGVYRTIVKELRNLGFHNVEVGLLLEGKFLEGSEKSNIIVTNIDNMFKPVTTSNNETLYLSYQLLYGNCVFDEYHEYFSENAIMAAFDLICHTRQIYCNNKINQSRMLLLSATSTNFFFNEEKKAYETFNHDSDEILNKKIHLIFTDRLPERLNGKNYLYSTNSVGYAQDVMMNGVVDNIITGRFLASKKEERCEQLLSNHGKHSSDNSSWVSTSIALTGLDMSFNNGAVVKPTPDRTTQAIGRINRWNEYDGIPNIYLIKCDDKKEVGALKCLGNMYSYFNYNTMSDLFYDFLKERFSEESTISLRDWYAARKDFLEKYKKEIKGMYISMLKESYKNLSKINYSYGNEKKDDGDKTIHISSKPTLRRNGDLREIFIKVKDENGDYVDEVFQFDRVEILDRVNDAFWDWSLKDSKFLGDRRIKQLKKKSTLELSKFLKNMATCSDTPLMIPYGIYTDETLGIIINI